MHIDAKSLSEQAGREFSRKAPVDRRNQEIADNFYVERAEFTVTRGIGENFADHLMTGYPSMVRRDLGDMLGSMLRPKSQPWMHMTTTREDLQDHAAKAWLENATLIQRRAMYDPITQFSRATKMGDHDYAAFGGCAISTEMNLRDNALLYRCWHLRDMAWEEDSAGQIGNRYRKWKPTIRKLCDMANRGQLNLHEKILERKEKDQSSKVECKHLVIRADEYDWKKSQHPWVELWIDCDNNHIMAERGMWTGYYTIPRWAMGADHYPVSPATIIALPDGRLLQAMTLSMLDLAERAADPPTIGVAEAIRGDFANYPGGFTAVDAEYDERLGEVLRPLTQDKSGIQFGLEMLDRTQEILKEAFYLNTLTMPPHGGGPEMTAFETGQRVQEYIRRAMPIFEPIEDDYNGALCSDSFELLLRNGAFGAPNEVPESIQGAEVSFRFESPLHELIERDKGNKFLETKAMVAEALALDQGAADTVDFSTALRDALEGIGAPAKWMRPKEQAEALAADRAAQAEAAAMLEQMQQGADVASTVVDTASQLEGAPI